MGRIPWSDRGLRIYVCRRRRIGGGVRIVRQQTKFTSDGKYLRGVGGEGTEPGHFHLPHGVALDSHDCLYVTDTMNGRIQKFATA